MTDLPHTYLDGVPSWVDLETPDPDAARSFYGGLFGWTFERVGPPDGEPYFIASLDGADAAGLGVGDAAVWNTYVAVDDADATVAAVREHGGDVVLEPVDAGPAGRAAICTDPTGVRFLLWQAGRRLGAQVVNVPNAWNFSHLHSDAPALDFYRAVFGWEAGDGTGFLRLPGWGEHLRTTVDPDILERQADAPDGFEDVVAGVAPTGVDGGSRWDVVFTVADRDAAAARAAELGGTVLGTADEEWTRTAAVRDPGGALFTLSQFTPPDS